MLRPGPLNLLTDVPGLTVGNTTDEAAKTGVTVTRFPGGWMAAVDVRGGGPGVRETAALSPENGFTRLHGLTFSGGSVFGLAAADAVTLALSQAGEGFQLRPETHPTPIVGGAVLYDLANDGDKAWSEPPYRRLGQEAFAAAAATFELGAVGAGRGAKAGVVQGGLGSASLDLGDGLMVGALVAVNSVGSVYMPDGKTFWAWPFEIDCEFGGRTPSEPAGAVEPLPDGSRLAGLGRLNPGANTTLALVAVNADLTAGECQRLAIMAQDGLSRAIRPAHTPFDGDVVFAAASGAVDLGEEGRAIRLARLGAAAGDCLARAIARGVHAAS